jgi:hypothetical protein
MVLYPVRSWEVLWGFSGFIPLQDRIVVLTRWYAYHV